jgi:hypothetical protein
MAMLSRLAATTQQPGDHQVTRYLWVAADSSRTYVDDDASRYGTWDLRRPVPEPRAAHFRYSGYVWFCGTMTAMVKDGYFGAWLATFSEQDSADFLPEEAEVWAGDEKQAEFEAGLSSCGLLPWWDEPRPLEEWEGKPVPRITGDVLRRLQAGPVKPSLVFQFRLEHEWKVPVAAARFWLEEWRYQAMWRRRERLAALSKSASPSPVSSPVLSPPSSPTTPEASIKWKEEAPRPKLFGQFDPTKYGLPKQFRGGARAA